LDIIEMGWGEDDWIQSGKRKKEKKKIRESRSSQNGVS
jgi:hypothetical protein